MKQKIISMILILTLALTMCLGSMEIAFGASYSAAKKVMEDVGNYMYKTVKEASFGSVGGEWAIYGFMEAGYELPDSYIKNYQKTVEDALEEGFRGVKGVLHDRKYTEYSRVIIAYSAIGADPTDIIGYNIVEKLADFDNVIWQGINGPIFALRALDSGNYKIPDVAGIENVTTRQKLIDYILEKQLDNGGWTLTGSVADPDMTAMAMESLAPYYGQKKVKSAIDKAVNCLSKIQNTNGGYSSWGSENVESCAQVISALSNVGINANTDSRFKKNGKSVLDALLTFYDAEVGGFRHVNTASGGYQPTVNQMATEQSYYALAQFFENVPEKSVIGGVTSPKSKVLRIKWKNQQIADGFQIKIAGNSGFTKSLKNVYVSSSNAKTRIKTITGLIKEKTYYVKIRAYNIVNGRKVYGLYSSVKKIQVK